MVKHSQTTLEILDDRLWLSLRELSVQTGSHAEFIMDLVEYGVLQPEGGQPREWRFPGTDLILINRAMRLRRDFDLNLSGLALALELLEEIRMLRRTVAELEERQWDEEN